MRGDAVENVGEPRLRIDAVHLSGDDEAVHGRGALAAASEPQNSHDFLPRATPRSDLSAALLKGMVPATPLFRLAFIA